MIGRCIALLVVLLASLAAPSAAPLWDAGRSQLRASQVEQPRAALLEQGSELQEADAVDRDLPPAARRTWPRPTFRTRSQPLHAQRAPEVVSRARQRDQRRAIRRLKTHAHVPRMEADPSHT